MNGLEKGKRETGWTYAEKIKTAHSLRVAGLTLTREPTQNADQDPVQSLCRKAKGNLHALEKEKSKINQTIQARQDLLILLGLLQRKRKNKRKKCKTTHQT